jgi:hypothetical protein
MPSSVKTMPLANQPIDSYSSIIDMFMTRVSEKQERRGED